MEGQQEVLRHFRRIPGVGPRIARDLWNLGLCGVKELKGQDPERLYVSSVALTDGARGFVRVIDGSGEDYVYHSRYFAIPDPAEGNAVPRNP